MSDAPVIIEASINGMTKPSLNPHVALTPAQIGEDVRRCVDAGASIIHAHNHDISLQGQTAADAYVEAWAPILAEHPETLWYPTLTSGGGFEGRYGHLELVVRAVPTRMGVVDPGSTNIGSPGDDGVPVGGAYVNTYADIQSAFALCERLNLGPALAIYEPGFLQTTLAYHHAGRLPQGAMVKLYFGGEGGIRATRRGFTYGRLPTAHSAPAHP